MKRSIFFYFVLINILLSSYLAYDNLSFELYFNKDYIDFSVLIKKLFKNKFDLNFLNEFKSFPMWGYGFVHLIFQKKIYILIFQQLINFYAICKVDTYLSKNYSIRIHRIIIIVSLPFFLYHTQIWPKSLTSSIFILFVLQVLNYLKYYKIKYLIIAGVLGGLICNLRSDYFFFIMSLPLIYLFRSFILSKLKKQNFSFLLIPMIIIIFLTPWGLINYNINGHFILSSTNIGHSLFIGLGQLPDNTWGIKPRDDDTKMKQILLDEFGENIQSVSIEGNLFLINYFKNEIKKDPLQFIKKCLHNIVLIFKYPFYQGFIGDYHKNEKIDNVKRNLLNFKFSESLKSLKELEFSSFSNKMKFYLAIILKLNSFIAFIFFFIIIAVGFLKSIKKILINDELFLFSLIIIYHLLISVFVFHMPVYNTSIYLIFVILTSVLLQKVILNKAINNN